MVRSDGWMDERIDGKPESISQFAQVDVTKTR